MEAVSALQARIQRLEDRQELSDLIARYETAIDHRDLDALAECFTRDAHFQLAPGAGAALERGPDVRGRENVMAFYASRISDYGLTLHFHHSQLLEFQDADSATGVVMAHSELGANGDAVIAALRYYDTYRREEGRWRFAERLTRFYYYMKMSELAEHLCDPLRLRWPGSPQPAQLPEPLLSFKRFHNDALREKHGG